MEMIRCKKCGIFYMGNLSACPYCSKNQAEEVEIPIEVEVPMEAEIQIKEEVPVEAETQIKEEALVEEEVAVEEEASAEDEKSVEEILTESESVIHAEIDPVVGWLVCTKGNEKGKDYRIHSDNNYIGSDASMDICISGDSIISKENHAIITYDSMDKTFYFAPGVGRSIVRLNGKAVLMTAELQAYDRLTLGETELLFVPLCGNEFQWG